MHPSAALHTHRKIWRGRLDHLKKVFVSLFLVPERLIEIDSPACVVLSLGLECLIAKCDPGTKISKEHISNTLAAQ